MKEAEKRIFVYNYENSPRLILRLPVVKSDILYYGARKDIALRKLFIPKDLHFRALSRENPNKVFNNIRIYW